MLTEADHKKIAAAVIQAEAATSGEILCVLAQKVSNYRETPLAWATAAALLLSPLALAFGVHARLLSVASGDWTTAGAIGLDAAMRLTLTAYAVAQIATFIVTALILSAWRPLKLALTPKSLKHRRVRQAAMAQLMATRLLGTSIGAAVVIFASIEDKMVVVVADEAIHAKVGDAAWNKAVAAVLDGVKSGNPAAGFVDAVQLCGALLAEHFPAAAGGVHNHLADGLLEL